MDGIIDVFNEFAKYSGLSISLEKSTLFAAGISPEIRTSLADIFPF